MKRWHRMCGWCGGEISSLLTVKTLTGMTTDVYPREALLVNLAVLLITVKVEPTLELSSEIYKTLMA